MALPGVAITLAIIAAFVNACQGQNNGSPEFFAQGETPPPAPLSQQDCPSNDDAHYELRSPEEATEDMAAGHVGLLHDKPLAGRHQYLHQPVHGRTT